mmetsp:Transcript_12645/g.27691  ORF Transcript_12645/g.27691 Transcript_12645/m.27691 type:complete len:95 (+) Transcript_12645:728-1012(+)
MLPLRKSTFMEVPLIGEPIYTNTPALPFQLIRSLLNSSRVSVVNSLLSSRELPLICIFIHLAQKMIDEYIELGIPPEDVWPQSFNSSDGMSFVL